MTTLALPPPPWLQNDEIRQTKPLKDKFLLEAHVKLKRKRSGKSSVMYQTLLEKKIHEAR